VALFDAFFGDRRKLLYIGYFRKCTLKACFNVVDKIY